MVEDHCFKISSNFIAPFCDIINMEFIEGEHHLEHTRTMFSCLFFSKFASRPTARVSSGSSCICLHTLKNVTSQSEPWFSIDLCIYHRTGCDPRGRLLWDSLQFVCGKLHHKAPQHHSCLCSLVSLLWTTLDSLIQNPESHSKLVSSPGTTATDCEIMAWLKATLWKPFPAPLMFWPQSPQLCRVLCWSWFIILSATPVGFHENECVGKPEKLTLHQPVNTRLGEGAVLALHWNASHDSFPK